MPIRRVRAHDHFPSGDGRALLERPFDPPDLAARDGLAFEDGIDDLDRYRQAAIALPNGPQAWLVTYHGERDAGTTVYVDASADLDAARDQLLQTLSIADAGLTWVAPGVTNATSGSSSAPRHR